MDVSLDNSSIYLTRIQLVLFQPYINDTLTHSLNGLFASRDPPRPVLDHAGGFEQVRGSVARAQEDPTGEALGC